MAASLHSRGARWSSAAALACALLAGCGEGPSASEPTRPSTQVKPNPTDPVEDPFFPPAPTPECNPSITVTADSQALIVRDPAVLEGFSLHRVLTQIIKRSGLPESVTPEELLKRLFDTQNTSAGAVFAENIHCDSPENKAFKNSPAVGCPRAEGALATSSGLFTPGHPDYFAPVALVNRSDLMTQAPMSCGEHRIVFAKWSGRTDPSARVFLIFEAALQNPFPGDVMGCYPVAKLWSGLEGESNPEVVRARLEGLYFDGLSGFQPVVDPIHYGLKGSDDEQYGHQSGQIRLSQRMEDPWEMREFRFAPLENAVNAPFFMFLPATVKNNPMPELFEPAVVTPSALSFRDEFIWNQLSTLAAPELKDIRMLTQNMYNAGESAVSGVAETDYVGLALDTGDPSFGAAIDQQIANLGLGADCPPGDPLTAEAILSRATVQSCAGCHAPSKFLGPERKIGCGLTWPDTLGEVHIDEKGTLSDALTSVFLPRRAGVLQTFAQACNMAQISDNLLPQDPSVIPK